MRAGDYARTKERGYDVVFIVDGVELDPDGDVMVSGEVSDRHGSDARDPACPYSTGDYIEARAERVEPVGSVPDARGEGAVDPEFDFGGGL